MAIEVKKIERRILAGVEKGRVKTYGRIKAGKRCDLRRLCKRISASCSLSSSDVMAAVEALQWAIGEELKEGNTVSLGDLGTFRLTVSTNGVERPADFNKSHVRKANIRFRPGPGLRAAMQEFTFKPV